MSVPATPSGSRASHGAPTGLHLSASIPNAVQAINVSAGLFMDSDGGVFPITNWFDEDGDECPRSEAVTCVAGEGGCWFALNLADFIEKGASA